MANRFFLVFYNGENLPVYCKHKLKQQVINMKNIKLPYRYDYVGSFLRRMI